MTGRSVQESPELRAHATRLGRTPLRELCAPGQDRSFLVGEAAGILVDSSRARVDGPAWEALLSCAQPAEQARDAMFALEPVNETEGVSACHFLLRAAQAPHEGAEDLWREVERQRARMLSFARAARPDLDAVVHIGIGGSALGPRLACAALEAQPDAPVMRFLEGPDPDARAEALRGLDPGRTLFVISSKTFSTAETLHNAEACRSWLSGRGVANPQERFAAITARPEAARAWGVDPARIFTYPSCVGGRFSLWAGAGLAIALHAGQDEYLQLLRGARAMDEHFLDAPVPSNLPVRMALLYVWEHGFLGAASHIILPYPHRLRLLPDYLQQLLMESLGKRTHADGSPCDAPAPVIWGAGGGSEASHSVMQSVHQGAQVVCADLVISAVDSPDEGTRLLLAQALAQADLLAFGDPRPTAREGVDPAHSVLPGGRPSTLIHLPGTDAPSLGALLALYEHATVSAAALLGINAFDQFGVERGKVLTREILREREDPEAREPATGGAGLLHPPRSS